MHAIEGIPLNDRVGSKIGLPPTIENDASAAAWGEFRFESASEVGYLVFFTWGTGIWAV